MNIITNQTFVFNSNDQPTNDLFDANGNTRTNSGNTFGYDVENHLTYVKNTICHACLTMNNPREPYNRLFDRFDKCFAQIAQNEEGFIFELRAGPNIGRALLLKDDPLKRGFFRAKKALDSIRPH